MGQNTSIFQSSYQNINNDILEASKSNCVNVCVDDLNLNEIDINNSTVSGNITIKTGCVISGASCTLKSSLDNSVVNNQKNQMSATISSTAGLLTILNNLSTIASTDDIDQNSYQNITNDTTQSLLSTCNFRDETSGNVNIIDVNNANVTGSINLDSQNVISNTNCTQVNTIKNYLQNSQSNTMKAKIEKTGCCAGIFGILILVVVAVILLKVISSHSSATKKQCPTGAEPGSDEECPPSATDGGASGAEDGGGSDVGNGAGIGT